MSIANGSTPRTPPNKGLRAAWRGQWGPMADGRTRLPDSFKPAGGDHDNMRTPNDSTA